MPTEFERDGTDYLHAVSRFSPGIVAPSVLEATFVARHGELNAIIGAIRDGVISRAGHHILIIGPRGSGKSHLLSLVNHRLRQEPGFGKSMMVAHLREEERGVHSVADFLIRVLRAVAKQPYQWRTGADEEVAQKIDEMLVAEPSSVERRAFQLLVDVVGPRMLLVLAENLNDIFSKRRGMARTEQRRLRDLIQANPFWNIVGTAVVLNEDFESRSAPFYGFFKILRLEPLTFQESIELLQRLAQVERRQDVVEFLKTDDGRGRARALHELTKGNPRLLVILFQFLQRDALDDISGPFMRLVDDVTAYYQEQLNSLSALQQRIVAFLAENRIPANVGEIARHCLISPQTASAQLLRLTRREYVRSTKVGRESHYELRDPLMRICFEVKENRGAPIRMFVDFLGKFYSLEELRLRYRSKRLLLSVLEGHRADEVWSAERSATYYEHAAQIYHHINASEFARECVPENLRSREAIMETVRELIDHGDYSEALRLTSAAVEQGVAGAEFKLQMARRMRSRGERAKAVEEVRQLLDSGPASAELLSEYAGLLKETGDLPGAEQAFRRALELSPADVSVLGGLGELLEHVGRANEVEPILRRAVQLDPTKFSVLLELAGHLRRQGHIEEAREALREAARNRPDEARVWLSSGVLEEKVANFPAAAAHFRRATELSPEDGHLWYHLGKALERMGAYNESRTAYVRATEVEPQKAGWYYELAVFFDSRGEYADAEQAIRQAISLKPSDAEYWRFLGLIMEHSERAPDAHEAYLKAVELAPSVGNVWHSLGHGETLMARYEEAKGAFQRAISLEPRDESHWACLAYVEELAGRSQVAREYYQRATDLNPDSGLAWLQRGAFEARMGNVEGAVPLLQRASQLQSDRWNVWRALAQAAVDVGDEGLARVAFAKSVALNAQPETIQAWIRFELASGSIQAAEEKLAVFRRAGGIDSQVSIFEAEIARRKGDLEGARAALRKAVESRPNDGLVWVEFALVSRQLNDEGWEHLLDKGKALLPRSARALVHVGEKLRAEGAWSHALACYGEAIVLDPADPFAHFNIPLTHIEAGNTTAAVSTLRSAMELFNSPHWDAAARICVSDILVAAIERTSESHSAELLHDIRSVFLATGQKELFAEAVVGGLSLWLKRLTNTTDTKIARFRDVLNQSVLETPGTEVIVRIARVALDYLLSKDSKVLLGLALEEREKLTRLTGLPTKRRPRKAPPAT